MAIVHATQADSEKMIPVGDEDLKDFKKSPTRINNGLQVRIPLLFLVSRITLSPKFLLILVKYLSGYRVSG